MPKVRRKCTVCGRDFWAKPKKLKDNLWHTPSKCQRCKNRERQKEQRKNKEVVVRVIEDKVNLKREVDQLIFLENKYPKLVDKIRGKEVNEKKKEKSSKSSRSKKKVKG